MWHMYRNRNFRESRPYMKQFPLAPQHILRKCPGRARVPPSHEVNGAVYDIKQLNRGSGALQTAVCGGWKASKHGKTPS